MLAQLALLALQLGLKLGALLRQLSETLALGGEAAGALFRFAALALQLALPLLFKAALPRGFSPLCGGIVVSG
ncbi:MAG: hypothetical protein ACK4P1_09475, partial [Aggregatilineales bacterium]